MTAPRRDKLGGFERTEAGGYGWTPRLGTPGRQGWGPRG